MTGWLTPKAAATYASCDVVTLRRAVAAGRLPAYRINGGRRVRFRAVDIDAWLSSSPVEVQHG
jgi:excisionase family DNA binding protein